MIITIRRAMLVAALLSLVFAALVPFAPGRALASGPGTLTLSKKNKAGTLLQDSCFALFADTGGGVRGRLVATQCDRYDGTPNNGRITFVNLEPGSYVLVETRAPAGYAFASDRVVTITSGETTNVNVVDPAGGSTVIVTKVDKANVKLMDACFDVYTDAGNGQLGVIVASACDGFDGSDGKTTLRGLRNGSYVLFEVGPPFGYQRADNVRFKVTASGSTIRRTVVNELISERDNVVIKKVNGAAAPVAGACFELYLPVANSLAPGGVDVGAYAGYVSCDSYDGLNDGTTTIQNVDAAKYVLVETVAPAGYQLVAYKPFTKSASASKTLTITDRAGGSRLIVRTVDLDGNRVGGACVSLSRSSSGAKAGFVAAACDTPGGAGGDGEIVIPALPGRSYVLSETRAPDGYRKGSSKVVTVGSNTEVVVTIKHRSLTTSAASAQPPTAVATAAPTETAVAEPIPTETPAPDATETASATAEATVEAPIETPEAESTAEPSPEAPPVEGTPEA